jgi:hypothetical protein
MQVAADGEGNGLGFRVTRRIKVAPGVRVNLTASRRGLTTSVTAGPKGVELSVNSRGQKTTTVGFPGSGISHVSRSSAAPASIGGVILAVGVGLLVVRMLAAFIG